MSKKEQPMNLLAGQTDEIQSGAQAADVVHQSLHSYIQKLEAIVAEVMPSWQGGADQAFKEKQIEWRAAAENFLLKLEGQGTALQKGGLAYGDANVEATSIVNGAGSGAPWGGALGGQRGVTA
ncbi:WXG100 family type VII secretion target [Plantactinospora sp. CA-290183]|uniref:WXG100 family type VII secretion target n=1 Tax=Plantactinospora sp. CA-290183 TaxID=3240006 RepID=UPI003D912F83